MTLDPARPEKTRRGVWGGVAPPVGLGFGMRPPPGSGSARNTRSGSARNTRNYPSRVQEGIWVWVKYSKLKAKKDLSIPTRPP